MPAQTPGSPSRNSSRKFVWLGLAVVGACVLWTAGWFVLAAQAERHLPETLARITGAQATASCDDPEIRGYPFRFGLFCRSLSYANAAEGLTATAGPLRSAAQVYNPGHAVAEIDGPLAVQGPGLAARVDWQLLQASVVADTTGIARASLDSRTVYIDLDGAGLSQKLAIEAERLVAHARKNGADLDLALQADGLHTLFLGGLTTKAAVLEATVAGRADVLDIPYTPVFPPYQAMIHRFSIALDDSASLEFTGPVEVGADGLLSGKLDVTLRNPGRLVDLAAQLDPELGAMLGRLAPLMASLDSKPGDDGITLPLSIADNRVSLGIFPLGTLPGF
ncbi:DUF2125 domain-containing protein [Hoeflea olei]|uniref:DUF2125 domain-containing protein n=1 Tax=Hoeflea olei TaxID=1480615 RepID=A0A1C1YXM6_9HYPH|nr:DUF2125 domain-containing protein [Hoeflea olei]OCW58271.1 hypothetical protein AWJ14_21505 [Hoeflea olei]